MKAFAFIAGSVAAGGTNFDYCSIHYSSVVEDDLQGYFLEVFDGFDVPLS